MATLVHLGNMVLTKKADALHVQRQLLPTIASADMRMMGGGRRKGISCEMTSGQRIPEEELMLKMPEMPEVPEMAVGGDLVPSTSADDALRRGGGPAGRHVVEREEESSGGGRRRFMLWSLLLSSVSALTSTSAPAEAASADDTTPEVPLESYSDAKDGFTLLRPALWNKVDKPGASIFFEDPMSKSNNIGVTVSPVRIASLDGFGTPDDIAKKIVKVERDKPSTNDMQVIRVLEKKLRNDTLLYSLEYTLDTSRGNKRVLTSVTVAGYKLYILNIVFADGLVAPASSELNDALHQVLNSFELLA